MTELQIIRTLHPPEPYLDQLAALIQTESPDALIGDVKRRLEALPSSDRLFLAVEGETLVGYAHLGATQELWREQIVELRSIIVGIDQRRNGVGRRLITAAETWAFQRGEATVLVRTAVIRKEALAFFSALGYSQTSTTQEFMRDLDATRRSEAPTKPQA